METSNRRSELLALLISHDDGTGTLRIIVDQALTDDANVTLATLREIIVQAERDARDEHVRS